MKKKLLLFTIFISVLCLSALLAACNPSTSNTSTSNPTSVTAGGQVFTVEISAENMAFSRNSISVPAGSDIEITFNNKDRIPHNVAFYETKAAAKAIFIGEVFSGPKTVIYRFTAPATPGTYFFRCDVHPSTMNGDFIVTAAGN